MWSWSRSATDGNDRSGRVGRRRRRRHGLRAGAASEFLRLPGRRRRIAEIAHRRGRCWLSRSIRSAWACCNGPATTGRTSWWRRGSRWARRCCTAGRTWGSWPAARSSCGACRAGSPGRRSIAAAPLLGADAANPRTAYPPRKGDQQHLHQSGAVRPAGGVYLALMGPQGCARRPNSACRKAGIYGADGSAEPRFGRLFATNRSRSSWFATGGRWSNSWPRSLGAAFRRRAAGPLVSAAGRTACWWP
jgi:hypothetical protein